MTNNQSSHFTEQEFTVQEGLEIFKRFIQTRELEQILESKYSINIHGH